LNVCAVLSQLKRHEEALEHVLMSVVLLQQEYLAKVETNIKNLEEDVVEDEDEQYKLNRAASLSIAYHNMGVELEYLKRFDEAIRTYKKAVKFATTQLGPDHEIV